MWQPIQIAKDSVNLPIKFSVEPYLSVSLGSSHVDAEFTDFFDFSADFVTTSDKIDSTNILDFSADFVASSGTSADVSILSVIDEKRINHVVLFQTILFLSLKKRGLIDLEIPVKKENFKVKNHSNPNFEKKRDLIL